MTFANKLTFLRLACLPLFLILFYARRGVEGGDIYKILATLVFIVAAITDYFDGAYARANKEVTLLGKFMDPVADKILVAGGFLCLMEFPEKTMVSGWMVVLILGREFMVNTLRQMGAAEGLVIAAGPWGKWKVAAQLTAVITGLVFLSFEIILKTYHFETPAIYFLHSAPPLLFSLHILAVIVTLYSGWVYLFEYRTLLFPIFPHFPKFPKPKNKKVKTLQKKSSHQGFNSEKSPQVT